MTRRTPLGRARGMGAARDGVPVFWWQRLTGLALVPLAFWFVLSLILLIGADYPALRDWMGSPFNATLMLLLIFATLMHGQLGLIVILEDYVHSESIKLAARIAVKFGTLFLGVFSAVCVFRVGFVGG